MKIPEDPVLLDPADAGHFDFLSRIQGNILKGHGRHHGCALFFRLREPGSRPKAFWGQVRDLVTSAASQDREAALHKTLQKSQPLEFGRGMHRNFALSAAGMQALGVADTPAVAISGRTPDEDLYPAFNHGMRASFRGASPKAAAEIADWQSEYNGADLHGVWLLACSDSGTLKTEAARLKGWLKRWEISVVVEEPTTTWRHRGRPREAFGFVDGISMPEFFRCRRKLGGPWMSMPLRRVFIPPEINPRHSGGSFLVVRKLEQNVKAFREHEKKLQAQLEASGRGYWMAGPLLMGRKRDGKPLVRLKSLPGVKPLNGFDFDDDQVAQGCPFHAHIRKMNPRMDQAPPGDPEAKVGQALRDIQIVRRGMLYDPEGRLRQGKRRSSGWPEKKVGLLFMAFMADPGRQFEVLHLHWGPDQNFPVTGSGGMDPILAQDPQQWAWRQLSKEIPRFVTPLGGEYFYAPALDWLNSLAE